MHLQTFLDQYLWKLLDINPITKITKAGASTFKLFIQVLLTVEIDT